ncbi:hypothetical protein [Flagellimonas sp.]|uniref:hypothetical protein n=1 Tax=Flagellimonas sp. TaxID=2058762 RepID=UPI003B50F5C2
MFSKSNLLATVVATIVMFVLGYLLWGMAAESLMGGHVITDVMKDPPDFLFIVLGNLVSAFALSNLYSKWARGHHSAKEGAEFGAWVALLAGLGTGLIWYATANLFDLTGHLLDFVLTLIFFVITGVVIAVVHQKTATKEG